MSNIKLNDILQDILSENTKNSSKKNNKIKESALSPDYVTNFLPKGRLNDLVNIVIYKKEGEPYTASLEIYSNTGLGMAQVRQLRKRTSPKPIEEFTSQYVIDEVSQIYKQLTDEDKEALTNLVEEIPTKYTLSN